MEIVGYLASVLIGVSLGLIGGGGSILTVPVLVYLFGESPEISTAYSLFVVGTTALIGGIRNATLGHVHYKTAIAFALPAIIAVYLTRAYLVPAIPAEIALFDSYNVTKDAAIMTFFAVVMFAASVSMIKNTKQFTLATKRSTTKLNILVILAEGTAVGIITGLVGAGGGFLIIPALVIFAKLPMKKAIGTSLIIIAAKSLIGFTGDLQRTDLEIDWTLLLGVTSFAVVGIFVGIYLTKFIDGNTLKKAFGLLVLLMAILVILKQIF
jgi:uncharacterized protein